MTNSLRTFFLALASSFVTASAMAQESGDRSTSFQAVSGSAHEDVPGGTLLVAAYAIVLCLLALYVLYLTMQQRASAKELARLEAVLAKKIGPAGTPAEKD